MAFFEAAKEVNENFSSRERNSSMPGAVILTALPVEYQAVRAHLSDLREVTCKGTLYEQGIFSCSAGKWRVGIAQISAGNASSAAEAERAITHFHPILALFVGVAGGLKDVQMGDVVIANKVYGYEAGKAEATFRPRPEVGKSTYALLQRAQAEARTSDWLVRLGKPLPQLIPRALVAPIAAGDKVVASTRSATWRFIKMQYSDAAALEMEGHGFLQATFINAHVGALIVRGVSDLIDGKSEADAANSQQTAAQHASAFAFELLAHVDYPQSQAMKSLPLLEEEEMPPLTTFSKIVRPRTLENYGSIEGHIQIGSNHTIQYITVGATSKEAKSDGHSCLERGRAALMRQDYLTAKQQLVEALSLLCENEQPEEEALVRYLLVLAQLAGKRPFGLTQPAMQRFEQLMQAAIALSPLHSYYYALAVFKFDFARNGWRQAQYLQSAQELADLAKDCAVVSQDKDNLSLLAHCQADLLQNVQRWL